MKTHKANTDDMKLINKYTRRELTAQQVYVFPVTLCDNEVDRDFECFTKSALEKLSVLFEGRTGIFDHNMKSCDQSARIFKTWVETDEAKKTSSGQPYSALRAKAYMVRTEKNKALIEEIDGGIKKEVSVGCSVSKMTCSVCGRDMKTGECEHVKGRTYGSKLCYGILSQPTDAYEWSFVAVPAQRAAGITKAYTKKEETKTNTVDIIKSATGETVLTQKQLSEIAQYIEKLESYEHDAKAYRNGLVAEIERLAMLVLPKVNVKHFSQGLEALPIEQLQSLKSGFAAQAQQLLPPTVQLHTGEAHETAANNDAFII